MNTTNDNLMILNAPVAPALDVAYASAPYLIYSVSLANGMVVTSPDGFDPAVRKSATPLVPIDRSVAR
jgi:hypothetical protein